MLRHTPLDRLVLITFFVLILGLFTLQLANRWALQLPVTESKHPWMSRPFWQVARLAPESCNADGIQSLLAMSEWVIWLDFQRDWENKQWSLICPNEKVFHLDSHAKLGNTIASLLPLLGNRDVIFNFHATDASSADSIVTAIGARGENTGIASTSQSLIREMRKRRPDWLFAADSSTWAKLKMFTSLGAVAAVDLWPDFFVTSMDPEDPSSFSGETATEIRRRKKILILNWSGEFLVPSGWKETLNGVLTNRPKNFSPDTFFTKMRAE